MVNPSNECRMFDITTGQYIAMPKLNVARGYSPGAVVIQHAQQSRIYVFGGLTDTLQSDTCEFIDVGDTQWTLLEARMYIPRIYAYAVVLDAISIVLCGGYMGDASQTNRCEVLDLTTHKFASFPDMLEARHGHGGVHYNDTIVIIGGYSKPVDSLRTCEQFIPAIGKWTPFAPLVNGRHGAAAAVLHDNIYVVGGYKLESIEVYDGSVWSIVTSFPLSSPRFCAVIVEEKLAILNQDLEIVVVDLATNSYSTLPATCQCDLRFFAAVSF